MCDAAPRKLLFVCSAWAVHVQCSQHPVWPSARPDITATQFIVRVAEPRPSWGISHSYLAISLRGPAERCWWREDVVKSRLIRGRGRGLPRRGRWRPHHATFGLASHAVGLSSACHAKAPLSRRSITEAPLGCDPACTRVHMCWTHVDMHACMCGCAESFHALGGAYQIRAGQVKSIQLISSPIHTCTSLAMRYGSAPPQPMSHTCPTTRAQCMDDGLRWSAEYTL